MSLNFVAISIASLFMSATSLVLSLSNFIKRIFSSVKKLGSAKRVYPYWDRQRRVLVHSPQEEVQ